MRQRNDPMMGKIALLVAQGHTATSAAKAEGILPKTARTWARLPAFKAMVRHHRTQIVDRTIGQLVKHSTAAVTAIAKLVETGENGSVKLAAAKAILEKMLDLRSHAETLEKFEELQSRLNALEGKT
jgi:hypothetical protein